MMTWLLGFFESPGIHSYKLSESPPINTTNSREPTVFREAGRVRVAVSSSRFSLLGFRFRFHLHRDHLGGEELG